MLFNLSRSAEVVYTYYMSLAISNVIVRGYIEAPGLRKLYKQKKAQNKLEKKQKLYLNLYNNKLILTETSFYISITKNTRELLLNRNLSEIIRTKIEENIEGKVLILNPQIININQYCTLNCDQHCLLEKIVPIIRGKHEIVDTKIMQEANVAEPKSLDGILNASDKVSFMSLILYFKNRNTIKFTPSKNRNKTHLTLITNNWEVETQELIKTIENVAA